LLSSHYKWQTPVPPEVTPPHTNRLVNESIGNNGVATSPVLSPRVPRELRDNPPKDITAMSIADMTPPPSTNALTVESAAPPSTASRRSWSQVISKDAEIQHLNMQLGLKNKRIERIDTYIGELKKKVRAEQKTKAKYKAQTDRFMGVAPIANNQPQAAINHKEEFENDLRACLKDSHKRLSLSMKAFIFGKVLQEKCFMNGMLFKKSITIMRIFYHDTVFPNHKVLAAMDERDGTLNYAAVEVLRDLERSYWLLCGVFKGKRFKAILPSKTDLHRAAKRIEAVHDGIVPFSRFYTPSGEGIKFHVIQVVILLIKAYGL
jgi:hypothetical protein